MSYSFFKHPDLDAVIGLALVPDPGKPRRVECDRIAVVLLSEGCSRSGKPGTYVYKRRNPDRRKLANLLLACDGWRLLNVVDIHTVRAGKTAAAPVQCDNAGALKAFRSGGNYRFDMWANISTGWSSVCSIEVEAIAEALGLIAVKHRPLAVRWEGPVGPRVDMAYVRALAAGLAGRCLCDEPEHATADGGRSIVCTTCGKDAS